ncbi:MAG: helix-hairpin-helix domain-containing protein [Phycisphaerales bacterium]
MSTNAALARRFEQMATILELLGEDKFRVNAHARAARTIENLTQDVGAIAADRDALLALDGVGPKVADKIQEFATTGKIKEHVELLARIPAGLLQVLDVPGLGPKTAKALWETLNVESLADLKRVIADKSILTVPRMGEKAAQKIAAAIEIAEQGAARLPIGQAMPIAVAIVERMLKVPGVASAAFAGSLRRGKETVGDIDILATAADPAKAHDAFCRMKGVRQVIVSGESKSSVRMAIELDSSSEADRDITAQGNADAPPPTDAPANGTAATPERTIQVDLRVVPESSWGAALMYFTGSKEHNVRLRERALKAGRSLNEYGLYPNDDDPTPPHKRGIKPIAGASEQEVYQAFGLPVIAPELREDRGEIDAAEKNALPRLIELADIKAEPPHTAALRRRALRSSNSPARPNAGFHTIAVTDHSKSSVIAGGLQPDRLREHAKAIRRAAAATKGIAILVGSEVDILADGSLDYDDDTLALLDIVVASPHVALSQDTKAATKRLLKAIEHPRVNILGHPTGRLIGRRAGLEPAMDEIIAAAKQHNVALEINAHWMRLDLRDTHVRAAVEAGCLVAIDCDVHAPTDYDNLRYGVLTARRGWLTAEQCVNCWDHARLHEWLAKKR